MRTVNQLKFLQKSLSGKKWAEVEQIALSAGVPYDTVVKIVNGATRNPRYATVHRLCTYLEHLKNAE